MMTTETSQFTQSKPHSSFNTALFEEHVDQHIGTAIEQFKGVTRQYSLFHIVFVAIACIELSSFVLFFSFLTQSAILAFSLAGIFLTAFSYFVLLFYFQAKKPEELLNVRHQFLSNCRASLPFEKESSEYHLSIAHSLYRLISQLHRQEYSYYSLPSFFRTLSPLMKKFSVWCHWKDLYQMKEMLLFMIIRENAELVKIAPTDLETHASLANAYLNLSKIYRDPRLNDPEGEHSWIAPEYSSAEMLDKFKNAAWHAIEEFKILDDFAPNDPWVHAQLASIYHELEMPQEEIREYEAILKISPLDRDILLRLGILYFSQGRHAQALRLYAQLLNAKDPHAQELISHYDAELVELE